MIREVQLPGGLLFVEAADQTDELSKSIAEKLYHDGSLPDGSRLTSVGDSARVAGELLKSQISTLAKMATELLKDLGPKELQIEAHIKFEGEVKIIPYIASAKGDGGLKITLKWQG